MSLEFCVQVSKNISSNNSKQKAKEEAEDFLKSLAKRRRIYLLKHSVITGLLFFYILYVNLDTPSYQTGSWIFYLLSWLFGVCFVFILASFLVSWKDEKRLLIFAEMFLLNPYHFYARFEHYFNPSLIWGVNIGFK